ncbi:MAG TPA: elongation factor G, partial [Myxococcales bacterium]|nr:elongation factor G [Myxococcales bacterium]
MESEVATAIEFLMDTVAEADDILIEKYLEEGELTKEEVRQGVSTAVLSGSLVPILVGSATLNIGVDRLLWFCRALPLSADQASVIGTIPGTEEPIERGQNADEAFSAIVIKTIIERVGQLSVMRVVSGSFSNGNLHNSRTDKDERVSHLCHMVGSKQVPVQKVTAGDIFAVSKLKDTATTDTLSAPAAPIQYQVKGAPQPMISFTVKPVSRSDVDKLKSGITKLLAEDIGLRQNYDEVSKELILAGMGTNHVKTSVEKLQRKYGVNVKLGTPSIPYREGISGTADVRYRHKKQTGGAGQFGEVAIRIRPNERNGGVLFVNKVV